MRKLTTSAVTSAAAANKIFNRNAFGMMRRPPVAAARICGKPLRMLRLRQNAAMHVPTLRTSSRPGPDSTTCGTSVQAR